MASYEDLMMQFYGNLGTAGQKFTSDILKPYITGNKTFAPPRKEVAGATDLQKQYFDHHFHHLNKFWFDDKVLGCL